MGTATISKANWDEILKNPAVTEVATMALLNNAEPHNVQTDVRLLKNFQQRAARLNRILGMSMEAVDGGR